MQFNLRRISICFGVATFCVVMLVVARAQLLALPAKLLIKSDTLPAKADVIIVLLGDFIYRPIKAMEVYQKKIAEKIMMAKNQISPLTRLAYFADESVIQRKVFLDSGIPRSSLVEIEAPLVSSTLEEALCLRQAFSKSDSPRKILIVTSWYHTRRANWIFRKVFKGYPIQLLMVATPYFNVTPYNWWQSESGVIRIFEEYLKWGYYLFHYSFRSF